MKLRCARALRLGIGVALCAAAMSCGGNSKFDSSGTTPSGGSNAVPAIVEAGPPGTMVANFLYVTVTVCAPGSLVNCQPIDHVQVDTGSYGLRIYNSALGAVTLPLDELNGNPLAECAIFGIGFTWGTVALADVQIGGETAKSMPVNIMSDPRYTTIPGDCSGTGGIMASPLQFGANGVLGIGPFTQDCPLCATQVVPGTYYACPTTTTCAGTTVPLNDQVVNPVALFAKDNNGSIISLPSVPNAGAVSVTGSLIFGIDTQSNNASGTQTVLTVDENAELTMEFQGVSLNQSFIDSGTDLILFNDPNISVCTQATNVQGLYCPQGNVNLSVTMVGLNGVIAPNLVFVVGNAQTMTTLNPAFKAFPLLAAPSPFANNFDYGLAFYFNRRVATALAGEMTSAGTGPYVAF